MPEKIIKTVQYEIDPNGDCQECKSYKFGYCVLFDTMIKYNKFRQCQACKDFLDWEKSKVYCEGCQHLERDYGKRDIKKLVICEVQE